MYKFEGKLIKMSDEKIGLFYVGPHRFVVFDDSFRYGYFCPVFEFPRSMKYFASRSIAVHLFDSYIGGVKKHLVPLVRK